MKQEKISTETGQKPGIQDRIAIFAPHIGQGYVVSVTGRRHKLRGISEHPHSGHVNVVTFYDSGGGRVEIALSMVALEVKSLSKISDEDAKWLFELGGWQPPHEVKVLSNGQINAYWAGGTQHQRLHPRHLSQRQADFLRKKGFAVMYENWSVEELVEFGILKLIE